MTVIRSIVRGCGSYLPEKIITNEELAKTVDTSDEWIVERSGIRQRHVAAEGELTSDLAINAAKDALAHAGLEGNDLDAIILATATPDRTFPATAARVQAELGMTKGFAFDLQAVCSGFVYALTVADNFIKAGSVKRVMVIGAETFSRILDWEDRTTCVLFGDGAGAVILEAHEGEGDNSDRGILTSQLHSDGKMADLLCTDGGPSLNQKVGHVRMKGREVFRHAVVNLADVMAETVDAVGLEISDISLVIPHQANKRILDGTAKKMGIPAERVVVTVDQHANTSAASVPLALCVAERAGRIAEGDLLLLEAMGGGFTWGAVLLRW